MVKQIFKFVVDKYHSTITCTLLILQYKVKWNQLIYSCQSHWIVLSKDNPKLNLTLKSITSWNCYRCVTCPPLPAIVTAACKVCCMIILVIITPRLGSGAAAAGATVTIKQSRWITTVVGHPQVVSETVHNTSPRGQHRRQDGHYCHSLVLLLWWSGVLKAEQHQQWG